MPEADLFFIKRNDLLRDLLLLLSESGYGENDLVQGAGFFFKPHLPAHFQDPFLAQASGEVRIILEVDLFPRADIRDVGPAFFIRDQALCLAVVKQHHPIEWETVLGTAYDDLLACNTRERSK